MSTFELQEAAMNYITVSGTNEAITIEIDVSEPLQSHPNGTGCMWYKRPDGETYLLGDAVFDTSVMSVALTDVEVERAGIAEVEAWWQDGTYLWKSPVYKLGIHQSFTTPTFLKQVNEEAQTTLEDIQDALAETIEARDVVVEAEANVESLASDVTDAHTEVMAAQVEMEEIQQIAQTAQTSAYNSSVTAQADKESAQAAAQSAASSLASIQTLTTNAQTAASAAQTYAEQTASKLNTVRAYDDTYLEYVAQAQAARDAAQAAQTVAVNARNGATSAMNTASESADKAQEAAEDILGMDVVATTLEPNENATVSYSNGTMTFGIPKGYTPVKGTDYWTAADRQAIIAEVLAAING